MRLRRTRMYAPGNNPKVLSKGTTPGADSVILDLEDSVAPSQKDAARIMVRYALENVDFGDAEVLCRVNPMSTEYGPEDVRAIGHLVDALVVPKCETKADVLQVDALLEEVEAEHGLSVGKVGIVPLIETAKGALNAYEVAMASPRNISLAFGAEDYTADVGGLRTRDGIAMLWARSQVVAAATAAGIQASDTVFGDFRDEEACTPRPSRPPRWASMARAPSIPNSFPSSSTPSPPTRRPSRRARRSWRPSRRPRWRAPVSPR